MSYIYVHANTFFIPFILLGQKTKASQQNYSSREAKPLCHVDDSYKKME